MNNFTWSSILIVTLASIVLIGCGTASQQSVTGSSDPGSDTDGGFVISAKAMEVMPSIAPSSASAATVKSMAISGDEAPAPGWEAGTPTYEVFSVLREYAYPRDEGVIDVSNIGKLLFEVDYQFENAVQMVAQLANPTAIASPFDFGTDPRVFTHASDHYASAQEGDLISALLTWIWDRDAPEQLAYGAMEGDFNEATGDLNIEMAYLVDYTSDDDYSLRTRLTGNIGTHQFVLKLAKHGGGADGYAISLVGAGVSEGDGDDDYFILKIIDSGSLAAFPEGRFFKVPASATEDDLRGLPATGISREELDDPRGWADVVDALTPFAPDGSDNPLSVGAFSNADLTLDF